MLGIPSHWIGWLAATSLMTFVVSGIALPWLLTRLPEDYFVEADLPVRPPWPSSRALYWCWRLFKNLLGVALLAMGMIMLLTPGQGILTILAGLWLMDFPGKRRWERRLIGRPKVLGSINWIRRAAKRPPLQAPRQHEESVP